MNRSAATPRGRKLNQIVLQVCSVNGLELCVYCIVFIASKNTVFCYGWGSSVRNRSSDLRRAKDSGSTPKQNIQFVTSEKLMNLIVILFFC